jgi:Na+/proline symporter
MDLHPIDIAIIFGYLIINVLIGIIVRRRATKQLDSYYLGDRNIPWWMLGLSGCSSYIDIGGTMAMIGAMFYLGLKSIWLTHIFWGWLMICFYMAFQAKYIRRSGVMTFAEWNATRFGDTREAEHARIAAALFLLTLMVFNLMYLAVGTGKFAEEFLPLPRWQSTLIVYGVVGTYCTLGGLFGVIITDIFQTILIALGAFFFIFLVFLDPATSAVAALKDPGWSTLAPAWTLWSGYQAQTPASYQHYYFFGPILLAGFTWMIFRVLAGPNVWDFQFFLTTKSSRDASLAAGTWTVGYALRWIIACSFLVLGMVYLGGEAGFDAEKIMPLVLKRLPVGLQGIFMAVLLAALMSTLSAMINVTSSVITNDILKRYFAKNLTQKQLVRIGQIASLTTIIIAFIFSLAFRDIVSAWETMIFVVVSMILVPATMRWHWWRFGAKAFVWSMGATAMLIVMQKIFFSFFSAGLTLAVDILASLFVTLLIGFITKPADMEVLLKFYAKVQPFGVWRPVRLEAEKRGLVEKNNPMPKLDALNGVVTIFFQISLALIPFYMFLRFWNEMFIWIIILIMLTVVLYFTWYKTLPSPSEK